MTVFGFFGLVVTASIAGALVVAFITVVVGITFPIFTLGSTEFVGDNSFTVVSRQALAVISIDTWGVEDGLGGVAVAHVSIEGVDGGTPLRHIQCNTSLKID